MANKIELRHGWDEEIEEFYINDEYLLSTNHDTHGWGGMTEIKEAIQKICQALNVEFSEVYKQEGDEDDDED